MATRQRKAGSGGRTTAKGGTPREAGAKSTTNAPKRRGPQEPETPVLVGRRPSSAGFLAVVAIMWMAVGVILFVTLSTGWKLIPAIVAFGIGVLFLRGAGSTVLRRERRSSGR